MSTFKMYEDVMLLKNMTNSLYDLDYPLDSELYPQILNIISRFDELFYDHTSITSETNKFLGDALTLNMFITRYLDIITLGRLVYKIFLKTTSSNTYQKDTYERYSQFFDSEVREQLARDTNTPLEVLENLQNDNGYYIRYYARETIQRINRDSNYPTY